MRKHILLVDDDADIRTVARLSLTRIGGFAVTEASSGSEAMHLVSGEKFDAILLDVSMPDADGPEVLETMRQRLSGHRCAIFFFTARVLPAERVYLESLGVDGVIEKPFDPVALPNDIRSRLLDIQVADRVKIERDEVDVESRLAALWRAHRLSLVEDVVVVERVITAVGEPGRMISESDAAAAQVAAREATHRLCGALGVYGRARASDLARELHDLVRSDRRDQDLGARARTLLDELRREIDRA